MPPVPPPPFGGSSHRPRIVLYQQTHHHQDKAVSLIPLITDKNGASPALSHLILAAIHFHEAIDSPTPGVTLRLNDHHPDDPRFSQLWDEVLILQDSGIKVLCMIGGAASGSFSRLDYAPSELSKLTQHSSDHEDQLPAPRNFEQYYAPLRELIRERGFDGIDLDVEETMSLHGIVHLIDRLRADFGPSRPADKSARGFLITLAPVATALLRNSKHLSGFDYFELRRLRGSEIDWYNVQFYNGWGNLNDHFPVPPRGQRRMATQRGGHLVSWENVLDGNLYDVIVGLHDWPPDKLVIGFLTNPKHGGSGYAEWDVAARELGGLLDRYDNLGGVMGWEYWGALPELETSITERQHSRTKRRADHEKPDAQAENEADGDGEDDTCYWRWAWRMRWLFGIKELRDRAAVMAAGRNLAALSL